MSIKDDGPAFAHGDPTNGGDPGMSLRDYMAAKAMSSIQLGLMLNDENHRAVNTAAKQMEVSIAQIIAQHAYEMADAMLQERSK